MDIIKIKAEVYQLEQKPPADSALFAGRVAAGAAV